MTQKIDRTITDLAISPAWTAQLLASALAIHMPA